MLAYSEVAPHRVGADPSVLDVRSGARFAPGFAEHEQRSESLDALDGEVLADRFRSWVGASGRRYIFSVFDPADCPAYCGAVLIGALVEGNGERRAIHCVDTGEFPEPALSSMMRACSAANQRLEFHLHLLANTASERRAVLEDLNGSGPSRQDEVDY